MGELVCNTIDWNERVECYHILEDNYYWEDWAYTMFDSNEVVKIGSTKIITRMLNLSKDIIQEVRTYAKDQKLELTWTHMPWTTQSAWWPDCWSWERIGGHTQIGKPEETWIKYSKDLLMLSWQLIKSIIIILI